MAYISLVLALVLSVCLLGNSSTYSTIHRILLLRHEYNANRNEFLDNFIASNVSQYRPGLFNITVLEVQSDSPPHFNTLAAFCEQIKSHGVSVIISLDKQAHPNLIDVYASYVGIPVLKIFHSDDLKPLNKEKSTILYIEPSPMTQLEVFPPLLKNYGWDRVAVISDENNSRNTKIASKLMAMLNQIENSGINSNILVNLKIADDESSKLKAINIIEALRMKAVVILVEGDVALKLMEEAQSHGFMNFDCVWILGNSLESFKNTRVPLLGKILGIRPVQQQDGNDKSLLRKEDFVKDSFNIITKALQNITMEGIKVLKPPKSCNSSSRWNSGKLLYRSMKIVKFHGHTGRIQFDENGFRTNMEYDMEYWTTGGNKSGVKKIVIAQYKNSALKVLHHNWPPVTKEDRAEPKITGSRILRVSAIEQEPYVVFNRNDEQITSDGECALGLPCLGRAGTLSCCSGYCIDLLRLLMRDIGFFVSLRMVKDMKYGGLDRATGRWSGLIGEVVRGEADMALADLTINQQRAEVVDFTHPYMDAGMGVMVKTFRRDKSNLTGFMHPFAMTLWVAIVVTINVVLLCLWLLERISPYGRRNRGKCRKQECSFNIIETTWYTWSLVFQTFDAGTRPKSFASRILSLSFAYSMLFVITSYTATLAAFLVVEEEIVPLNNQGIRDPKLQNPPASFKIATLQDSSFERFFQVTEDPVLHRIWLHMRENSAKGFEDAIRQMNSGELQVFVGDYPTFETFAAKSPNCSFKVVGKPFFQSGFGLALAKNSSLTVKISEAIVQYERYDVTRRLKNRWFAGQCSIESSEEGGSFARLSMHDFTGLFLVVCLGVIFSLIFFLIEFYIGHYWSSIYAFG